MTGEEGKGEEAAPKGRKQVVWGGCSSAATEATGRFRTKNVFITGMDLFTTEEVEKREKRAARFSTSVGLAYKPVQPSEHETKKKQRAQRFGTEYKQPDASGMMDVDLLESRKEASESSSSREETLHVYGVDMLSTSDVLKYFSEYGPQRVEWINDSSCNICFADPGTVKRILAGMGKPLSDSTSGPHDDLFKSMGKLWHKGVDFLKGGTPVPLLFRVATSEDVKPTGADRPISRGLWRAVGSQRNNRFRPGSRKRRGDDVDMMDASERGRGRRARRDEADLRTTIGSSSGSGMGYKNYVQEKESSDRQLVCYDI